MAVEYTLTTVAILFKKLIFACAKLYYLRLLNTAIRLYHTLAPKVRAMVRSITW